MSSMIMTVLCAQSGVFWAERLVANSARHRERFIRWISVVQRVACANLKPASVPFKTHWPSRMRCLVHRRHAAGRIFSTQAHLQLNRLVAAVHHGAVELCFRGGLFWHVS